MAGQTDLAIQYATMLQSATMADESLCYPLSLQAAALYNGKRLTSDDPILRRSIDTCIADKQPILTNTLWLLQNDLFLAEGQPGRALTVLDQIGPSLRGNHYYAHLLSSSVQRAKAYLQLGNDDAARKAALVAVGMAGRDETSEWLRDAYEVLYQVEKKQGHASEALSYYENYTLQDKGNLNDITARSLAFELSQQHTLIQKLETEQLGKQNSILTLQKALQAKAFETSKLYIVILLLVLVSIVFWLVRLKRSQLRFKTLACHDSLTGIFNHQHFMTEASRALRAMEKKQAHGCLLSIDLDHFKKVNDTHGHATGDSVLRHTVHV